MSQEALGLQAFWPEEDLLRLPLLGNPALMEEDQMVSQPTGLGGIVGGKDQEPGLTGWLGQQGLFSQLSPGEVCRRSGLVQ